MKLLMICSLMLVIAFISYVIYDYIVEKDNKEYKEKIVDYICDNSKGLELPKTSGELYVFNKYATDEMINELEIYSRQYTQGSRLKNPFRSVE